MALKHGHELARHARRQREERLMLPELRRMALGEALDRIPAAHQFALDHAFQRKLEWVADYGGEDRLTSMEQALLDSAERLEMQEALWCAMALQAALRSLRPWRRTASGVCGADPGRCAGAGFTRLRRRAPGWTHQGVRLKAQVLVTL